MEVNISGPSRSHVVDEINKICEANPGQSATQSTNSLVVDEPSEYGEVSVTAASMASTDENFTANTVKKLLVNDVGESDNDILLSDGEMVAKTSPERWESFSNMYTVFDKCLPDIVVNLLPHFRAFQRTSRYMQWIESLRQQSLQEDAIKLF